MTERLNWTELSLVFYEEVFLLPLKIKPSSVMYSNLLHMYSNLLHMYSNLFHSINKPASRNTPFWNHLMFLSTPDISFQNLNCCCFCWVTKSCRTLCDLMDCSRPGFSVFHYLPQFAHIHVHWATGANHSSSATHFSFCLHLSQHQGLFPWVGPLHQVAKVLELQLQHQSLQWIFRVDFL